MLESGLEKKSEADVSASVQDTTSSISSAEQKIVAPPSTPPHSAFPDGRKNFMLMIVTIGGFFGPLSGGIYLPALQILGKDFKVSDALINVTVSVFMIVFAIGPLLWAGLADKSGRRPLYIVSIAIFIISNVLLATVPATYGALITLRMLQAFGSCSVLSLGAGTVADVTEMKRRGFAMSIFLLGPQCGPILGPLLGGVFAGQTSWRWIFGFLAISGFTLWLVIIFFLPETLRSRVGNGSMYAGSSIFIFPPKFTGKPAPIEQRGPSPPKPTPAMFWRLFCYPPIGIVTFNTATLFAGFYCMAVNQPRELENRYGWNATSVGLSYLSSGIALVLGSVTGGLYSDHKRARAIKKSPEGHVDPENRLSDQIWGVLASASGILMYGWFNDFNIHPASILVALFLAGFGMTWVFVTSTSFLTECVPNQTAGVVALGGLLRNPAAAVAAVVIEPLVQKMGIGWCFTGLALIELVFVGGSVILLQKKGPTWRKERNAKILAASVAAAAKK